MGWDCSKEKVVKAEDRKIKETFSGWAKIGSEFFEQVPTGFGIVIPKDPKFPDFIPSLNAQISRVREISFFAREYFYKQIEPT